jgi:adenylyltransferase/sulfurtransferase
LIEWTEEQLERFSRQIVLPEMGGRGQERLLGAGVALVGMGGIGAPAALFLAAAGIGRLRLIDHDRVALSNLHRQVLFDVEDVGRQKVEAADQALRALHPDVRIEPHGVRLTAENAHELLADVDVVVDGTDEFNVRAIVASACQRARVPLVAASVQGVDGQLIVLRPYLGPPHPSYRCIFPEDPPAEALPSCARAGVLGPVPGTLAGLTATEVLKLLLERQAPAEAAPLICYDAWAATLLRIQIPRTARADTEPDPPSSPPGVAACA